MEGVTEENQTAGFEARKKQTLDLVARFQEFSRLEATAQQTKVLQRLRTLLGIALTNPWWRDRLGPYLEDAKTASNLAQLLGSLPVLQRADIQEFGGWMKTWVKGAQAGDYETSSSSGSTGKPVSVLKFVPTQKFEYDAIELVDFLWQEVDLTKSFLVYTVREEPKQNPAVPGEPLSFIGASGKLFTRTLHKTPIADVLELLRNEQIDSMLTSAGTLRDFLVSVRELDTSGLVLKNVLTFADRVDLGLRELAREVLGVRILDRYSTAEVGPLAIQCPYHEHLHALQLNNYIEILDSNYRPCAVGRVGKVVVSSLGSYGMPLIRYEIGDTASWDEPCDSEITLPVLKPEIVRIRESYVDSKGVLHNILPDKADFIQLPKLRDYQLLIFEDAQVLLLVGDIEITEILKQSIERDLAKITERKQPVRILVVAKSEWLERNKRKSVVILHEPAPEGHEIDVYRKYIS